MDPRLILAVLALNIALSEYLATRTCLRHVGTALLVIVITAVTANLGLLPTYSSEITLYSGIFDLVAPLGICLLLLQVSLREVLTAGRAMLTMFLIGALGTVLGVIVGMTAVGGTDAFGSQTPALGGMFVGTYIGGSINFNAIALEYDLRSTPELFAGANAVDALMTAVWMAACIILPRGLRRFWRRPRPATAASTATTTAAIATSTGETDRDPNTPNNWYNGSNQSPDTTVAWDLRRLSSVQ